jgi:hypothetical protein
MTETEWLKSTGLSSMLRCLCRQHHANRRKNGRRKLRLLACALARTMLPAFLDPSGVREAIEAAEKFIEGRVDSRAAHDAFMTASRRFATEGYDLSSDERLWTYGLEQVLGLATGTAFGKNANLLPRATQWMRLETVRLRQEAALDASETAIERECKRRHVALLRDLFGNPFRPLTIEPSWLTWNNGTVAALTQMIFEEPDPTSGWLDGARVGVLADALEEAGCADAGILNHLRGPGPHVRGCWVIDGLTGRD